MNNIPKNTGQSDARADKGERIAKVIARAGLCSRRDAERWIEAGRVKVNNKVISSPALNITGKDEIIVDDKPLPARQEAKLWRYHKPAGLVVSHRDEKGRASVFENLPQDLPRVVSVGRLDINTEGLLLLTNDGELARQLELPATGWLRRYRVRAFGSVDEKALAGLKNGITIDGIKYGSIEVTLDHQQGRNNWFTFALREGKNREIKVICEHLGLQVNRLIRLSFGPFQLGDLNPGKVEQISGKVLSDQIGGKQKQRNPHKPKRSNKRAHRRRNP
jgi:23S rRNA pseudouridine2605 synthase